ncbi:PAS domain S-box protein [Phormidium sp. CCY1219]|uniref:PAS domain S-box protein n=1 Tax=Phormidium sp. CCY1219 TaxID=2886104 RepID=UPI002D1E9D03|nr:PAS domain S-box protein [Phormidium sp. CCY1219]MEB3826717.1 PAS domain S-box protein [Phormidium sp. CCY1219]
MWQIRSIIPQIIRRKLLQLSQQYATWNAAQRPKTLQQYGIGIFAVTIATLLHLPLDPNLHTEITFLLFFAAVMVSAWCGGWRSGLLATVLSTFLSNYFFLAPTHSLFLQNLQPNWSLFLFAIEGVLISFIVAKLQAATQRAQTVSRQNQQHVTALHHSEEQFRRLVEGVKDHAIYMLDRQGRVASWNETASRIQGYDAAEILGEPLACFYPPEDIAAGKPDRHLKQAAEFGSYEEENWRVRQDGSRFWAEVAIAALRDEAGNLRGFCTIVRDVTERFQAREALLQSERRFRALSEATVEGIIFHEGGKILDANRAFAQIFGYELSEVMQLSVKEFVAPESLPLVRENIQTGYEKPYEVTGVKKDGTRFPVEIIGKNCSEADRRGRVCAWRDISDRKRVEEALRQSLKELSDLKFALDKSAIVSRTDSRGTINYVNGPFCEISQYSREELLGQNHNLLSSGYHSREFFQDLWATLTSGQVWKGEIKNKAKDGREYWVDTAIVPFLDERGTPIQYLSIRSDITQRKQAEAEKNRAIAALQDSEERFRNMADTAPVLLWIAADDCTRTFFNKSWLTFTGRRLPEELGEGWMEHLHPEEKAHYLEIYTSAFQQRQKFTLETRFRQGNGEYRWILDTGIPRFAADGSFQGFVGSGIDITDLKKAQLERSELLQREQQARARAEASEEYYRFLTEAIPQMVWTAKADGSVDYLNHRWSEYTGYSIAELLGGGWEPILHPDDLQRCIDRWHYSLETGEPYQIEARIKCVWGENGYRWILGWALPMRDKAGRVCKWFGTNTDIHEQKMAAEERRQVLEREQAARALAESATAMVQNLQAVTDVAIAPLSLKDLLEELLDRLTQVLQVDTATILLMDAQGETLQVKATKGLEAEGVSPLAIPLGEGFCGWIAETRESLRLEREAYTQVRSAILQEQQIQSLMGAPLLLDNRILGVVRVGSTTEREFSTEDLHLLELVADRIALAIDRAHLYDAEQQARTQAESANRLKDEFLAVVSHELRTPLNAILGWAQLLRARKLSEAKIEKALETIERNAKLQLTLIEDILDVSRMIRGKIRPVRVPVNLAKVVQEAIASVTPAAKAKSIVLDSVVDDNVPPLCGDPERLAQVFWNLLSNAVKFTPENGRVAVRIERTEGFVRVSVSDTGIGISAEFLPHVFEGFRQANSTTTRSHGGLGLGLTIVRYLVELHAGTVEVSSAGEGRGTTFRVMLPIASQSK